MSWYYVDTIGVTRGPVTISTLTSKYGTELKDTTYVWNGTTVTEWTPLNKAGIGLGILYFCFQIYNFEF